MERRGHWRDSARGDVGIGYGIAGAALAERLGEDIADDVLLQVSPDKKAPLLRDVVFTASQAGFERFRLVGINPATRAPPRILPPIPPTTSRIAAATSAHQGTQPNGPGWLAASRPSFQATLRHAGRDAPDDRPRKSALPEDYERPWHKKSNQSDVYKPGED